jgi:hypothetical protein
MITVILLHCYYPMSFIIINSGNKEMTMVVAVVKKKNIIPNSNNAIVIIKHYPMSLSLQSIAVIKK